MLELAQRAPGYAIAANGLSPAARRLGPITVRGRTRPIASATGSRSRATDATPWTIRKELQTMHHGSYSAAPQYRDRTDRYRESDGDTPWDSWKARRRWSPEEAAGSAWPPPTAGGRGRARVVTGRREAELEAAVKTIGADRATGVAGDISEVADLDRLYAAVRARGTGLDVLVANVEVGTFVTLEQTTEKHFDQIFGVNARGTLFTAQKALPLLNDGASIVLVGSTAADRGMEAFGAYAASKVAVRSFARTWSSELKGRGIRVNVVSPAWIETAGGTAASGDEVLGPGLRRLAAEHDWIGEVRGTGVFWAVELVRDAATREPLVSAGGDGAGVLAALLAAARRRGLLALGNGNRVHLVPPLTTAADEARTGLRILAEALTEVRQSRTAST